MRQTIVSFNCEPELVISLDALAAALRITRSDVLRLAAQHFENYCHIHGAVRVTGGDLAQRVALESAFLEFSVKQASLRRQLEELEEIASRITTIHPKGD